MPGSCIDGEEGSCICNLLRNCIKAAPAELNKGPPTPVDLVGIAASARSPASQHMTENLPSFLYSDMPIDVAIRRFNAFIANSIVTLPERGTATYLDTERPETIHSAVRNIEDYVTRLAVYSAKVMPSSWSGEVLCIAAIYMRRVAHSYGGLTDYNVHRFVAIAVWIATKYHLDLVMKTDNYSAISGIRVDELTRCENDFLSRIEYNLWVNKEEYESACAEWDYLLSLQIRQPSAAQNVVGSSK